MFKFTFIILFSCGLFLKGIAGQLGAGGETIYSNDTVTLRLSENSRSVSGAPGSRHNLEFILKNNGPQNTFLISQEGPLAGAISPSGPVILGSNEEKVINVRNMNMPAVDNTYHKYTLRAEIARQEDWNNGGNNGGEWGDQNQNGGRPNINREWGSGGNGGFNGGSNGGFNGGSEGRPSDNGGNSYNGGSGGNEGFNGGSDGRPDSSNSGSGGFNGGNGGYNGGGGFNGGSGGRPDGSNSGNGGYNGGNGGYNSGNGGYQGGRAYGDGTNYIRPGQKIAAYVTVRFQSKNQDQLDSRIPEILTESLEADCDEDISCKQQTWTALWRVKDEGSGLFLIKVRDSNNNIPFWWRDNFDIGSTNWVSVKAHVSCCAKGVDIEVEDLKNNNLIGHEEEEDGESLDLPLIIGVSVGVGVLLILLIVGGVCLFKKKYSPVSQSG